nr:hypothetical protein B0A51_17391 [Rachicladosporium sp. CCFEE 5018]
MPGRGSSAPKAAPRGPAALRRDRLRKDRDGDLAMDVAVKGRAARVGKSSPVPTGPRSEGSMRSSRGGLLSTGAQRAILKHAGAGDIAMKEGRTSQPRGNLELRISNWTKNKASSNPDGGLSSLLSWLEKKASTRLSSRARNVKIKKSRKDGDDVVISVPAEDVGAVLRLDGYVWAGVNVSVTRLTGDGKTAERNDATEKTRNMLKGVLERRYNADAKLLDFSQLASDSELQQEAVFNSKSTASKFFPAMMVVLDKAFDSIKDRDAAVQSVSLANNELADLKVVSSLSEFLPQLKNLDLSNNKFEKLDQLVLWRKRFHHLDQLVLSGNPIEQADPTFATTIIQWFPKLRTLNGVQVRTDEEIAKRAEAGAIPFPLRSASFQDEGGIVVEFVKNFILGFDTDRAALAKHYYDDKSDFSYAVNTSAPRDPAASEAEKGDWGNYIKNSRNLKKTSHPGARQHRLFRGTQAISDVFAGLPKTKHPDLAAEARNYMIEAHIQPGVPDLTGQSVSGVDGFTITMHGEFDEVVAATGQSKKKRSFDRTIVIGPSVPGSPSQIRVVNDILTIRAYGGAQAFDPDNFEDWTTTAPPNADNIPQFPAGVTLEIAEQMVIELQKQTRMTIGYAKDCLEQVSWDFARAVQAFESVKGNLPADAFVAE